MTGETLKHTSAQTTINQHTNVLETTDKDGIFCSWIGRATYDSYTDQFKTKFAWNFDWSKLEDQGVDRLSGFIKLKPLASNPHFVEQKIEVDFKDSHSIVTKEMATEMAKKWYNLTPNYSPKIEKISYDEMFAASEMNDTVLVVEGKKLHVSKVFLSYHSKFFRVLFSSNFKDSVFYRNLFPSDFEEGQMTEIPIKGVSFEDFGLLMSTIYPNTVFPNDKTAEKLLELADRFLMPSVTAHVEYHLLHNSQISNEKMIWMADAYSMPKLLEKKIFLLDTVEKIKALEKSEEYQKLSSETVAKLFKRIIQLV